MCCSAWLGACVVFDLRSRQVPTLLTVIPLILAAAWRFFQGGWQSCLLVVCLNPDLRPAAGEVAHSAWLLCCDCTDYPLPDSPDMVYAMLVIFAVWALWEIGATGGADAKIIIALVLLFANGLLFIPIVLVGGVQGLAGLDRPAQDHPIHGGDHPGHSRLVVDGCCSVKA